VGLVPDLVGPTAQATAHRDFEPLDLPLGTPASTAYGHHLQRAETTHDEPETEDLVEQDAPVSAQGAPSPAPGDLAVQRVEGAADPPATSGSSEQVDELARKLFDPLMLRLRAELLVDRERRGLRTDAW